MSTFFLFVMINMMLFVCCRFKPEFHTSVVSISSMIMVDPMVNDSFRFLDDLAPCFAINGDNVAVLNTPSEFYQCLLNGIKSSRNRIVLSALYLGTGELEQELINCLDKTLLQHEKENNKMAVEILFDYVRGSRGKVNSKTMLLPLVQKYSDESKTNLKVYFYHTPFLRGATKQLLPDRFNEIVGLNHLKVFVFDDHFLISGANLSTEYFEQRQDRYVLFKNCKDLSDYFHCLIKAVGSFSFQLQSNGDEVLPKGCPCHPFDGNCSEFEQYVFNCLTSVTKCNNAFAPVHHLTPTEPRIVKESESNTFKVRSLQTERNVFSSVKQDTYVYPSIQFGFVGMQQDERLTMKLLESFSQGSNVCFTSGYFNIIDAYSSRILKNFADFDIVTASPNANGFLKASGFAGKIPAVYSYLTKQFYDEVLNSGKAEKIRLWEYLRPNWTYHAKGLWFYDKDMKFPSLTMIGSSNFGLRSVNRDLEAQVTIVTRNNQLMQQLHREKCSIIKHSSLMSNETFAETRYYVPRWVSFVTTFIKRYF